MSQPVEERHLIFEGQVQGVFFRSNTEAFAKELAIKGFVRNLPDGTVELLAQGEPLFLDKLEEKLLATFSCHIILRKHSTPSSLRPDFRILFYGDT